MHKFQLSFFYDLQVFVQASDFYRKYYFLFKALDLSPLPDRNDGVGRDGHSRHAMLRALIVKHLEGIKSIPRLLEFLDAHPVLTDLCGFQIGSFPDETQFYRFQQDYPQARLKDLTFNSIGGLSNAASSPSINSRSTPNPSWPPPRKAISKIPAARPGTKRKSPNEILTPP
jgi:hypothetical protein